MQAVTQAAEPIQVAQAFIQTQYQKVAESFNEAFVDNGPILWDKDKNRNQEKYVGEAAPLTSSLMELAQVMLLTLLRDSPVKAASVTPELDAWLIHVEDTATLLRSLVRPGGSILVKNVELCSYCVSELYEMSEAFVYKGKTLDMRPTLRSYITAF